MYQRLYSILLLVVIVASTLPVPSEGSDRGTTIVFAVASSRSFDTDLPDLRYAAADLERFLAAMREMGRISERQIVPLRNPTLKDFRTAVAELRKQQAVKLIFYYSGHSDGNGLHLADGSLSRSELHDSLRAVASETRIAFVDSCFSGALAAKGVRPAQEFTPKAEFDEPSGSVFFAATGDSEAAFEIDALQGSLFTHYVVSGLYGLADSNTDGVVTVEELYSYVYREVTLHHVVLPVSAAQKPEYRIDLRGRGSLVLAYPKQVTQKLVLGPALYGEITFAAENGLRLHRIQKAAGETQEIMLYPGRYQVRVKEPQLVGGGVVVIRGDTPTQLDRQNLIYEDAETGLITAKGKASTILLGTLIGVHAGLKRYSKSGDFAELDLATKATRVHVLNLRLHAFLGFRRHNLITGQQALENEVLVGISGAYFLPWGLDGQQFYASLLGGMSRLREQGSAKYSSALPTLRPEVEKFAIALGSTLPSRGGWLWSLDYRREFLTVTSLEGGQSLALAGNLLALAVHF